ncbi:hypothetical protein ACL2XP_04860 [Sodalis sp. RH21]|uniref:hypothetical protein n=1 Tax=unclassified Sodalis (in: enterobacteria) TaxID=2636512 RepID=UPI0039B4ACAF
MMNQRYFIFLLKDGVVTPQSLEDPDAGTIIRAVLLQQFAISPIHIRAADNHQALAEFQRLTAGQPAAADLAVTVY